MMIFAALAALALLICTIATALSVTSVFRITARRPTPRREPLPPVSVLKPLCGADDALEANLETFFRLDYPAFELVFGVEGAEDPAVEVVRRLRARYPEVATRLVIHDGKRALNPKVSNLRAILSATRHDLVLISDSNVAVDPGELASLVHTYRDDPRTGLVTSLFAGIGEETLGATLENLHLAGPISGGVAISDVHGRSAAAVGKSMLFSRDALTSLGGLPSVATVLAEDFVIGRMFEAAGYRVRLAPTIIRNTCARTTVRAFFARHLRWGLIRSRLIPHVYALELLFNPMAVGLLAAFAFGSGLPLLFAAGLTVARDALQWCRLRGRAGLLAALPLGPLKELAMIAVWAAAPFFRRVSWRGRRYRVGAGTRLYAEAPSGPPTMTHWE